MSCSTNADFWTRRCFSSPSVVKNRNRCLHLLVCLEVTRWDTGKATQQEAIFFFFFWGNRRGLRLGMKTVRIFFDRIRNRIRLEGLRSVRIRVRISNIRYRIRIRILKSYIYDVDIQSYPIRHSWHYPYSNPNPDRNMKTNVISVISVRIRSVFILTGYYWN